MLNESEFIAYFKSQTQLVQETGYVMTRIDQLTSSSTSRLLAVAILTAQDVMRDLFQTTLAKLYSEELVIKQCRPKVLKNRFGSRQVIAYKLTCADNGARNMSSMEVIGKRYADPQEGEKAFRTMQMLWQGEFGQSSRLKIPKPLCYLPDYKLLIQEKARGKPLPEYLGRGDAAASARMRLVAHWLVKLHRSEAAIDGIDAYDDATSLRNFAQGLGERYPHLASHLQELAAGIQERLAAFKGAACSWVHGDFHPENIFVTEDKATVIDFDQFCQSDPARDLGYIVAQIRAMTYFSTGSLEASNSEIRVFLDTYFAALSAAEREGLFTRMAIFAARQIFESMYYILCVLDDERPDVLSAWLNEAQRLSGAKTAEDIMSQ